MGGGEGDAAAGRGHPRPAARRERRGIGPSPSPSIPDGGQRRRVAAPGAPGRTTGAAGRWRAAGERRRRRRAGRAAGRVPARQGGDARRGRGRARAPHRVLRQLPRRAEHARADRVGGPRRGSRGTLPGGGPRRQAAASGSGQQDRGAGRHPRHVHHARHGGGHAPVHRRRARRADPLEHQAAGDRSLRAAVHLRAARR